MNDYVFKDEFADNLPPDITEQKNTEEVAKGEGCLRLVFIQIVICALVVLTCLVLKYAAPKAYASVKNAYTGAVKTEDITFEDVKNFRFYETSLRDERAFEKAVRPGDVYGYVSGMLMKVRTIYAEEVTHD